MKEARDIAFGFVIFFMIDRSARLGSAIVADRRQLNELQMEKLRCSIELVALLTVFFILLKK